MTKEMRMRDKQGRFISARAQALLSASTELQAQAGALAEAENQPPAWLRGLVIEIAKFFGITPEKFKDRVKIVYPTPKDPILLIDGAARFRGCSPMKLRVPKADLGWLFQNGHPADEEFEGCDGWKRAVAAYPTLRPPQGGEFSSQGDVYRHFVQQEGEEEIETVEGEVLARYIIADAELLFCLLTEQTERKLEIISTERRLRQNKASLEILSAHPGGHVVMGIASPLVSRNSLGELLSFPPGITHTWRGIPAIGFFWRGKNFVLLLPFCKRGIPTIRCTYDGEHLIALHNEGRK